MLEQRGVKVWSVLVHHFFGRFFDKESLSPQSDAGANVIQTLGILAVPGAFFVILCQPLTMRGWDLVMARFVFVSFSMIAMSFIVVLKWDALFPDRRDYLILTPLPLGLLTLFITRVVALAIFLGLFLLDLNFFCTLFWPGVDNGPDLLPIFGAHITAVVAGGLFAALAAASVQGVLATLLGGKLYRRISVAIQTLLMAALVMLLFLTPMLAGALRHLAKTNSPLLHWYPAFWFVGFYERIRPATGAPVLLGLGRIAVFALCAVAILFLLAYLPGYRRHARRVLETATPNPAGPGLLRRWASGALDRVLLHRPSERAVFHFISETITRSPKHRIFLATYGGFGAALAVLSIGPNRSGLLPMELTLSFILVSGLRAAFNFPSELNANWAFQLSEIQPAAEYLAAMRKWIVTYGILPLFVLFAAIEFTFFPWTVALFHLAFGIMLSVLLMDIMFFGFRKVPFTCAYFPGKMNLAGLSAIYVFGFTAYSGTMTALAEQLLQIPWAAVAFFAVVISARVAFAHWSARIVPPADALDYEDAGDPVVRTLGITPQ